MGNSSPEKTQRPDIQVLVAAGPNGKEVSPEVRAAVENLFQTAALQEILEHVVANATHILAGVNILSTAVKNLRVSEDKRSARADFNFPQSEWSNGQFMHAADTLIGIGAVCEVLTQKVHPIRFIDSMRWRTMMKGGIAFIASLDPFDPLKPDDTECVIDGICTSTGGMPIYIRGHNNGEPIMPGSIGLNPYAQRIFRDGSFYKIEKGSDGTIYRFPMQSLDERAKKEFLRGQGLALATLIELTNLAFNAIRQTGEVTTTGVSVFAGVENIDVPSAETLIANGGGVFEIEPRHDQAKTGRSGFRMVPIDFSMSDPNGQEKASGRFTAALSTSLETSAAFYAKNGL